MQTYVTIGLRLQTDSNNKMIVKNTCNTIIEDMLWTYIQEKILKDLITFSYQLTSNIYGKTIIKSQY